MKYVKFKEALLDYTRKEGLAPGDSLPTIMDLTRIFRVSATTVRRGVRELTEEGTLNSIRGSGIYLSVKPRAGTTIKVVTRSGKIPVAAQSADGSTTGLSYSWICLAEEAERRHLQLKTVSPGELGRPRKDARGLLVEGHVLDEVVERGHRSDALIVYDAASPHSAPAVWVDMHAGSFDAASYLFDRGHTRVGYAAWFASGRDITSLRGILKAHEQRGIAFSPELLVKLGQDDGKSNLAAALDAGMTALILKGGRILETVTSFCRDSGISTPGDLSLMGLSGSHHFLESDPPVTSLESAGEKRASQVLDLLNEFPMRKSLQSRNRRIVPSIIERNSVADIRPHDQR